jgi:YggT family protein
MPNILDNAGIFLVSTVFDLLILVFLLRIILVAVYADFSNPVSQIVIKCTQRLMTPLQRIIPNFKRIELASVLIAFGLEILKFLLLGWITVGLPHIGGLLLIAGADLLKTLINLFFYAILLQAIISWFNLRHSPYIPLLEKITAPVLTPFHRIIPLVSGIDLSPVPAMIILQLLIIALVAPLYNMGWEMAFG